MKKESLSHWVIKPLLSDDIKMTIDFLPNDKFTNCPLAKYIFSNGRGGSLNRGSNKSLMLFSPNNHCSFSTTTKPNSATPTFYGGDSFASNK